MPTTKQCYIVTLAMMISGIVIGKTAQLSKMSGEVPSPTAKPKSIEKRRRHFVKNKRVDEKIFYMSFAEMIGQQLGRHPLYMALDGSTAGRGCMVVMVGVVCQRLLPLAWVTDKGKKGHTTAARHIELLQLLRPLIPTGGEMVLLGDAEYDTIEMLEWVKNETDWRFVVRSSPQLLISQEETSQKLRDLSHEQGTTSSLTNAYFTAKKLGPIMAIAWWGKEHKKPIYLITNLSDAEEACRAYKKRFKIETMFSDKKRRGFHIHMSHLSEPKRVGRLLLASCLAYLWMIYLGVTVMADEHKRRLIDRTERVDKSLFRLGLDWLNYSLGHGLPFEVSFYLPPSLFYLSVR